MEDEIQTLQEALDDLRDDAEHHKQESKTITVDLAAQLTHTEMRLNQAKKELKETNPYHKVTTLATQMMLVR